MVRAFPARLPSSVIFLSALRPCCVCLRLPRPARAHLIAPPRPHTSFAEHVDHLIIVREYQTLLAAVQSLFAPLPPPPPPPPPAQEPSTSASSASASSTQSSTPSSSTHDDAAGEKSDARKKWEYAVEHAVAKMVTIMLSRKYSRSSNAAVELVAATVRQTIDVLLAALRRTTTADYMCDNWPLASAACGARAIILCVR
jgi:hypothetical protein